MSIAFQVQKYIGELYGSLYQVEDITLLNPYGDNGMCMVSAEYKFNVKLAGGTR